MLCPFARYLKPLKVKLSCFFIFIVILFLIIPCPVSAWETSVDKVHDGDTIQVFRKGREVDIRFYGIDCPEKDQPYGMKAKRYVSRMCKGKTVEVVPSDRTDTAELSALYTPMASC